MDVGSYEWKSLSTTYYLEHHLGWSGIAIDANADLAEGYVKHRPRTSFFSFIVSDHSGAVETFYLAEGSEGVSSTSRDWARQFFAIFFPGQTPTVRERQVETITLNEILRRQEIQRFDFLSMDIEGGEPAALAGFDIQRFRPELVCIEGSPKRAGITEYFLRNGYERIDAYLKHDLANMYFRPGKKDPNRGQGSI